MSNERPLSFERAAVERPVVERPNTERKALAVNLDQRRYGSLAEIGAGQEVVRWFFRVSGAAGTIANAGWWMAPCGYNMVAGTKWLDLLANG